MSWIAWTMPFDFEEPIWLWLCLLVPILIAVSIRSLAGIEPIRRVLSIAVRCLLVVLVAFCLAGVQSVQRNEDLTVLYLMDRSHSVQEMQEKQEQFIIESTKEMPPDDRAGMIDFARNAYLQQLPMRGGYFIAPGRLPVMPNTDRTDIATAVRLAMAMFPHDTAKRIVLMSDGNDNMGDLLTEARRAKANGVPVDVVPLQYRRSNEVFFERLIAPTHASPGEQVPLRMVLNTTKPVSGTILVYRNGDLLQMPSDQSRVSLKPGRNTFFIKIPIESEITQSYEAIFRPDRQSDDSVALNNTSRAFTFVSGSSRVLVISGGLPDDQPMVDALRSENVLVDLVTPAELGDFLLPDMMSYSTIVLSNVPAASFTEAQQEALAIYVKDMGSGLIMTGGDEGFGAGGWIGTKLEEVMPVTFEIKHKRVIPRGALVLIMHSCEIARGNFWGKEMAKKSVDTVSSQDYIGVLTYTYSPGGENWEVPFDRNRNKSAVKAQIDRMQMGDMPDFGRTMQMAYKELANGRGRDAAQKHVIIMSDGDASPPSPKLLADYKKAKITVSTIALGWGGHVFQPTMIKIAKATGGRFYAARNPKQLPQIFTKESKVVRRPLIIDEPFQPVTINPNSDLLAGGAISGSMPPLGGMVLTSPKQSPNVVVPIVRATDDGEDPVLAHWQYELGKTVAFTSGYWAHWGQQWTGWPKFAKFWAQIVRWTMRQDTPANFDTYTKIEGNRGRIVIDALDKDASYLNNLAAQARVIGPNNEVIPTRFMQTGPGKYEAVFEVTKAGQYLANVRMSDQGRDLGTLRTGLTVPFSPEYRDLIPNEALLRQVVDITDGRWLDQGPMQADVFSHDLPLTEARKPAWEWVLAWLLLPLFLLDVAVRRLASWLALSIAVEVVVLFVMLFGLGVWYGAWWGILGAILLAELIGWTIRFRYIGPIFDYMTHSVTALGRAGERSAASLDKLKDVRERVLDEREDVGKEKLERISQDDEPVSIKTAKRKYEATGGRVAGRSGDLSATLGGAQSEEKSQGKPKSKPGETKPEEEQEDATSRLLRAKRRARKDIEE